MVLSDADREEARARLLESPLFRAPLPPDMLERMRARAESLPLPEEHPAFTELICDRDGYLWVALPAHADAPAVHWEVFDREGAFRATVELPRADRVLDIGGGHVLSVRTDQLGVEYVELRTLTRR